MTVPATTAVRRSRVGNVDTDRLLRRRAFLVHLVRHDSRTLEQRIDFVFRAAELAAIENALSDRGALPDARVTLDVRA